MDPMESLLRAHSLIPLFPTKHQSVAFIDVFGFREDGTDPNLGG